MTKENLQKEILRLLKSSSISKHQKEMTEILLPVMEKSTIENIYNALKKEERTASQLTDKKKRIQLKYEVLVQKLSKAADRQSNV